MNSSNNPSDKMRKVDAIIVNRKDNLIDVIGKIDRGGFGFALVADSDKVLAGVVTDGDIRRGILRGADLKDPISTVMNPDPTWVEKGTSEGTILNIFKTKNVVGKVPVVDRKRKILDLAMESKDRVIYLNEQVEMPKEKIDTVLVIGGAGFIGSVLSRMLLDRGYKVKVFDTLLYGEDSLNGLIGRPGFEFIKGDTRHIEDLTKAMQGAGAVVHLAELVGDPACALDAKTTKETNLFATMLIANICKHLMINKLVYMSSCSVYGDSGDDALLTETSALNPVSLYARMKIESENSLLGLVDDTFSPCILRLATVFGYSYRPRFDLVVNTLTAKAVTEKKIEIFGGDQWRPNVHVTDVCEAIITVLEASNDKIRGQIFNVGSVSQNYKIKELGEQVAKNVPGTSIIIREDAVDKRNYRVSFEKIENVLSYKAKKTVVDGITEIREAFEKGWLKSYKDKKYSNYLSLSEAYSSSKLA
jgi:nucleoside-diphosphate-sugar epimerase